MKLFFNYSIDCELPLKTEYTGGTERQPFFGGPKSWEAADASVRGFVRQMDQLGLGRGTTLFVYPDVARHQRALYREMAGAGVEVALHLNGLRYSRRRSWLAAGSLRICSFWPSQAMLRPSFMESMPSRLQLVER